MAQRGKFLRKVEGGWAHYCPGCEQLHYFAVDAPQTNGARWTFDGNIEKPTFHPSMNIGNNWCHYNLVGGQITFCDGLMGHGLSRQTVPLPELPPEYQDKVD